MSQIFLRELKIMRLLLGSHEYMTIGSIAGQVSVTGRTVQNDIERLRCRVLELGLDSVFRFDLRRGRGVKVTLASGVGEAELNEALAKLDSRQGMTELGRETEVPEILARRIRYLEMLLNSRSELTIGFLADQGYVSKTVATRDLEWMDNWLSPFNLHIEKKQNRGILIRGQEWDKRNALVELLALSGLHKGEPEDKANIEIVNQILKDAETVFDIAIPNEYYLPLLIHLLICVSRIVKGDQVDVNDELSGQYSKVHMEIADEVAARLEKAYHTVLPRAERDYICIHLMGAEVYRANDIQSIQAVLSSIPPQASLLAKKLVKFVGLTIPHQFSKDKTLLLGLMLHLKTAIHRLKGNYSARMNAADHREVARTRGEYPEVYRAVFAAGAFYEGTCDVSVTEDELSDITLHFAMAIARRQDHMRAVFVSNSGQLSIHASCRRLVRQIPLLNIVDICKPPQLSLKLETEYDFVITQVPLTGVSKPIFLLSNEPDGEELEQIRTHMGIPAKASADSRRIAATTHEIFPKNSADMIHKINALLAQDNGKLPDKTSSLLSQPGKSLLMNGALWVRQDIETDGVPRAWVFLVNTPVEMEGQNLRRVVLTQLPDHDVNEYAKLVREAWDTLLLWK